jgi:hypothetical protein
MVSNCVASTTSRRWSIRLISLLTLAFLSLYPCPSQAQAAHSVALTWTASTDAAANPTLTYNVYRLNGACPATAPTSVSGSGFTKLNAAAITTTTFSDSGIAPGTYCYFATAFLNTTESIPSNDAAGIVQPKPPTSFGISAVAILQVTVPVDSAT